MKKFLLICLLMFTLQVIAQEKESQIPDNTNEKSKILQSIEALKIAYMTKELNLSAEEAQKFWPVYNSFSEDLKKAKSEFRQDDIAFEERKVVIMKKYRDDFKKILSNDDRVKKCFRAEPEFHKLLRKEWNRRQMQPNRQQRTNGGGGNPNMGTRPPNNHPNHPSPNGGGRVPRG